jgi:hypothetical protein
MGASMYKATKTLRELVFEALNAALDNGYREMMQTWSATEIAYDLIECVSDLETQKAMALVPIIKDWKKLQP